MHPNYDAQPALHIPSLVPVSVFRQVLRKQRFKTFYLRNVFCKIMLPNGTLCKPMLPVLAPGERTGIRNRAHLLQTYASSRANL
jgi:hypothetical protein